MSQPQPYSPAHSFLSDQAYASWFPGAALDVELNNLKTTTDQVRGNLKLIQRDDGALAREVDHAGTSWWLARSGSPGATSERSSSTA